MVESSHFHCWVLFCSTFWAKSSRPFKSWFSGRGGGQQLFNFQSPVVQWMARTSSLNCLSCRNPYQTPHSLNFLPPFHWKPPFLSLKGASSHPLPKNRLWPFSVDVSRFSLIFKSILVDFSQFQSRFARLQSNLVNLSQFQASHASQKRTSLLPTGRWGETTPNHYGTAGEVHECIRNWSLFSNRQMPLGLSGKKKIYCCLGCHCLYGTCHSWIGSIYRVPQRVPKKPLRQTTYIESTIKEVTILFELHTPAGHYCTINSENILFVPLWCQRGCLPCLECVCTFASYMTSLCTACDPILGCFSGFPALVACLSAEWHSAVWCLAMGWKHSFMLLKWDTPRK